MEIKSVDKENYSPGEIRDICRVFNDTYKGFSFREDYVKWRYFETPYKQAYNFIAYEKDKPVGHTALCPRELIVDNKIVMAGQSLGNAVLPGYQKMGLFSKMAKKSYDKALGEDIRFIWGFPNHNAHYGKKTKLKWEDIYEIPTKQLLLGNTKFEETTHKDVINTSISSLVPGNKIGNDSKIFFLRNKAFFKWRYVNNPRNQYFAYTINDENIFRTYLIYKIYEVPTGKYVDVVDFEAETNEDFKQMLLKLILDISINGEFTGVNIWINTNHKFSGILEMLGFINNAPITFFSFCSSRLEYSFLKKVSNYKNWLITMGDSDVF